MPKPFHLMGSESPRSVDEIMAKNGIKSTCRCDKCNAMVKLLDKEIQRYWEKSIAFWLHHHNFNYIDKCKLMELMKNDLGKFDNKVTESGDDFCSNSPHIYERIIDYQSLNSYLDYLDKNTNELELINPFSM
ncbi:uncharacterized protein LOC123271802 [Cotesia glomerata]|uniref:Uncharacterized protein n=1 Tax=Cotesia glomerata TaxID=32391 RepID=A0AAV7IVF8_COTGL|nr:uncharacterized protein LOC123271802 [Cotesia glomerata]KAH0558102.1 hypothetical protein KQX54_014398 [Cotesia glomerata]